MSPIAQHLRRGLGVALSAALALPLSATAAEPFIDASALEAEQAWINPLWRAVRGPATGRPRCHDRRVRGTLDE